MPRNIALYIHIPFCRRKCLYCSFVSYDGREADIASYLRALKGELAQRVGGEYIGTIYIGGGTPSLLSAEQVEELLSTIRATGNIDDTAEITLEANPGTIDTDYLTGLRKAGINRLSLGVQSLNDNELRILGRIHTADEARATVRHARNAGFDNLSLDLIYGLPGQTTADWRQSLEESMGLKPDHLSLYALTLDPETPMQSRIEAGELQRQDPDTAADLYELAEDILEAHGYNHYEISNWALAGHESRHNLTYWENRPYIGAGVAAHSCLNGRRFANTKDLDTYTNTVSDTSLPEPELDEKISPEMEIAETVILGLRLMRGIDPYEMSRRFDTNFTVRYQTQIQEMTDAGLLENLEGKIKLTRRGRLLSNEVFWRFLPD